MNFHVLQRQPGAQHYRALFFRRLLQVCCGRAGLIHAAATRPFAMTVMLALKAVDRAVLEAPGQAGPRQTPSLVHQQVERKNIR